MVSLTSSPSVSRRQEKEAAKEAKREEKAFNHTVRELERLEKRDNKTHKTVDKTAKTLEKTEIKEQKTLHDLHKATEAHENAKLQTAHLSEELESWQREETKVREELRSKRVQVEDAIVAKDSREKYQMQHDMGAQSDP
ncbi:hypothetical protein FA15DRAFT_664265 [Coprinopsis marcescibilis]|uniref:Uncharacterized protein n=1 Tax=Coprinopsis marcescibilis TaxID=230819 RepID=A0A5C3L9Z7_COPMA|nr:hypothetical protein FA15DRAFT_664265 [Coprinopsis marcescibilis]